MNFLLHIGYGNTVMTSRIISVLCYESAPIRRMVQAARERDRLLDATFGRKARSVIVTDNDRVILTALQAETLSDRISGLPGNERLDDVEISPLRISSDWSKSASAHELVSG